MGVIATNAVSNYFQKLADRFGNAWNRFWFTPREPYTVCVLRILTGTMALWFLISFSSDLVVWFGTNGLLPMRAIEQLTAEPQEGWNARLSYLYWVHDPSLLWLVHGLGILVVAAFTLGLATRVTAVLSLVVVLSYIHRAPMITGQFEPVLSFMLFYLCFAPCGRRLSLDAILRRRRNLNLSASKIAEEANAPSLSAAVSLRLIQVHVALLYLMMGLTKLGGSDTWWAGEAVWWLIAHTESRLVDLTFLHSWEYLLNLWTHGIVLFELAFGLLVWNRLARPLLLAVGVVHWILLGLITGLLSYALIMLVANAAFLAPPAERPEPK